MSIQWIFPIILSLTTLVGIPLTFYSSLPNGLRELISDVIVGWNSLLHISIYPLIAITSIMAFIIAHKYDSQLRHLWFYTTAAPTKHHVVLLKRADWCKLLLSPWKYVFILSLFFTIWTISITQLQIISPSWVWNPFMWSSYKVYKPEELKHAMDGICLTEHDDLKHSDALCLPEDSWRVLSSDALSSHNAEDVNAVRKGLQYAKEDSGGLVINVLSRDTVDSIPSLRHNVEALVPLFSRITVVIFENDSKDGTRKAFQEWAKVARGYTVDLMQCSEHPECQFGESHRYDSSESKDYFKSSAIGRMAEYRQRIVSYILEEDAYKDYSHMLVVDLDLGVSISPLGILHSLGTMPDSPVASSGRQVWPGSSGTLIPPYDFSAFRAYPTERNSRLLHLHDLFCGLQPPGDRWRNQCDAVSSMHFMVILGNDFRNDKPYRVLSAFNGATLYPVPLMKSSGARYDAGDDAQRCEHIGFNLSLQTPFYVNPKWDMHVDPTNPGGPTGMRAAKNVLRIVVTPAIAIPIFCQNFFTMVLFVYAVTILVMYFVYPVWVKTITGATCRCFASTREMQKNRILSPNTDKSSTTISSMILLLFSLFSSKKFNSSSSIVSKTIGNSKREEIRHVDFCDKVV